MSVLLYLIVCRLCVPNIVRVGVYFLKLHLIKVGAFCLIQRQSSRYFRMSHLKVEQLIKKQTYMKTEAYKLCSRIF